MLSAEVSQAAGEITDRDLERKLEDGGAGFEHGPHVIARRVLKKRISHGVSLLGSALCARSGGREAESAARIVLVADRKAMRSSILHT